jgi:beta-1,4-mannooligosaccharide/beta-1,4-mannosyl-N-acetylglucosamine phosphorylase
MELPETVGALRSSPCVRRHAGNPVLTAKDVPFPATLVYNAGICKFQGQYVMVFRNDVYDRPEGKFQEINLGLATSRDGVRWEVAPKPCFRWIDEEVLRCYDPRLTVIEGRVYMCFAVDTRHGLRGGIAVTDDLEKFEVLHLSAPDNRNMVLFPERLGGKYVRLERPFPIYSRSRKRDRFDAWISDSPDLRYWGNSRLLLAVEDVPFANDKVGPAAPPVLTKQGWLTLFHAVDIDFSRGKNGWEEKWQKRYTAGIMLLDRDDPGKIIGLSREPLLVPEAPYEISGGIRNHVIFPGGMVLEPSGEVKIYYGSADTVECLATADVGDLLKMCVPRA